MSLFIQISSTRKSAHDGYLAVRSGVSMTKSSLPERAVLLEALLTFISKQGYESAGISQAVEKVFFREMKIFSS